MTNNLALCSVRFPSSGEKGEGNYGGCWGVLPRRLHGASAHPLSPILQLLWDWLLTAVLSFRNMLMESLCLGRHFPSPIPQLGTDWLRQGQKSDVLSSYQGPSLSSRAPPGMRPKLVSSRDHTPAGHLLLSISVSLFCSSKNHVEPSHLGLCSPAPCPRTGANTRHFPTVLTELLLSIHMLGSFRSGLLSGPLNKGSEAWRCRWAFPKVTI